MIKLNERINWYKLIIGLILLFGVFLITKLYIVGNMFEDDECRLALSMTDKNVWQMFLPLGAFSASPIFMFFSKMIAKLTNYNEYALKFIPYVVSILNLLLFYKLAESYFNKKISVILSCFLFTVNFNLLYFSSIFKQYTIEVLITILCLKYLPESNILEMSKKQFILFSFVLAILPLISLPALYFIFVFLMINIFRNFKSRIFYKKFFIFVIPIICIFGLYYCFNLIPSKALQLEHYQNFWNGVYSVSFIPAIASVFKFLFAPNKYILCLLLSICVSGLYILCKKNEHNEINIYLLSVLFLAFLSSGLNLYPLLIGRTAIFLIPILILLLIKIFDLSNLNKILRYFMIGITLLGIYSSFSPSYISKIYDVRPTFRYYAPDEFMQIIINNGNSEKDEIITTESSMYYVFFYGYKYDFDIDKIKIIKINKGNDVKEEVYKYLNSLPSDKYYWFYLIKEYPRSPQQIYVIDWLKNKQSAYYEKKYNSYLYYIKNLKEISE